MLVQVYYGNKSFQKRREFVDLDRTRASHQHTYMIILVEGSLDFDIKFNVLETDAGVSVWNFMHVSRHFGSRAIVFDKQIEGAEVSIRAYGSVWTDHVFAVNFGIGQDARAGAEIERLIRIGQTKAEHRCR